MKDNNTQRSSEGNEMKGKWRKRKYPQNKQGEWDT